jgi:hypothetical protein
MSYKLKCTGCGQEWVAPDKESLGACADLAADHLLEPHDGNELPQIMMMLENLVRY